MKKSFRYSLLMFLSVSVLMVLNCVSAVENAQRNASDKTEESHRIKNVIIMVPDGCSNSIQTLARWKKGVPLTLDSLLVGAVKTCMTNSVISGSAAAVTAFATGYKTKAGFLSVGPDSKDILSTLKHPGPEFEYRPLATVLEGAKLKGKSTGLVATSRICHATPAGFAAHVHQRHRYNEITEQMVYENVDVAFAGGKQHLLPESEGGRRKDGENLLKVLLGRGYHFVETGEEMMSIDSGKVWGLFADGWMEADVNRRTFKSNQPSLAEMTEKAIEILSLDEDGFFLMVEGSQIDWAGHANDPIYMVGDFLAFDGAVRVALDFARKNENTLLLVFPDHDCGALSIGQEHAEVHYKETEVEDLIGPLEGMKVTAGFVANEIGSDFSYNNVSEEIKKWWGIDITEEEFKEIKEMKDNGYYLSDAISEVVCRNHTVLGWTTHGHTGVDVPLWAYGPGRPVGLYDNTELAEITASALGFDLDSINKELFVEAGEVFPDYEMDWSDSANPVLKINNFKLPVNKNILQLNGKTHELNGIVVYAPVTGKVYIPEQAVRLMREVIR